MTPRRHLVLLPTLLLALFGTGGFCSLPPDAAYGRPCARDVECDQGYRCGPLKMCEPRGLPRPTDAGEGELDGGPADSGMLDAGPEDAGPDDDGGADGGEGEPTPLLLEPAYEENATWGSYIKNDGPSLLAASGAPCAASDLGKYGVVCTHAGELRRAALPGLTSCEGVSAGDALEAFEWGCSVVDDVVYAHTSRLRPERRLFDLLEADELPYGWRQNRAWVTTPQGAFASEDAVWWTNPVRPVSAPVLDEAGVVWLAGSDSPALELRANGASLVVRPGEAMSGPSTVVRSTDAAAFLWLEGDIVATGSGSSSTVRLQRMRHSRVRHWNVIGLPSRSAIELEDGESNLFEDVIVEGGSNSLFLDDAHRNRFERVTLSAGTEGIEMNSSHENLFVEIMISATYGGLNDDAIDADGSSRNTFALMRIVGNERSGIVFRGGAHHNVVLHSSFVNNGNAGIRISGSYGTYLEGVMALNNGIGLDLNNAPGTTLADITAVANGIGMRLNNVDEATLLGAVRVGSNSEAGCTQTGSEPPLFMNPACRPSSPEVIYVLNVAPAGLIVGAVSAEGVNESGATSVADAISDWARFETPTRAYIRLSDDLFSVASRGRCHGAAPCALVDVAVPLSGPSGARDVNDVTSGVPELRSHTFVGPASPVTVELFAHTVELEGDGDGLCEPGERCLVQPNSGGYAGHGALLPREDADATLFRYETNGY